MLDVPVIIMLYVVTFIGLTGPTGDFNPSLVSS
jgi:hypothetical protein